MTTCLIQGDIGIGKRFLFVDDKIHTKQILNVCIGSFSFFINSLTDEVISVFHPKLRKEIDQKFYYFIDTI